MHVDGAEQLEMKKHFDYERRMNSSSMMSLLASVGSSESPTSPVSSQRMLYRRLGDNDNGEFHRNHRILVNIKNGASRSSISGKSSSFF